MLYSIIDQLCLQLMNLRIIKGEALEGPLAHRLIISKQIKNANYLDWIIIYNIYMYQATKWYFINKCE